MVRIDLVRDKIRRLRETLAALGACLPAEALALANDRDRLDLVSFRVLRWAERETGKPGGG
jgi:hypothetical protein